MTFCPAKINLGLSVHHRRESDGYHYLSSIFLPIDFGDELHVAPAQGDELLTHNEIDGPRHPDFESVSERGDLSKNLVWQALEKTRRDRQSGARVILTKRVPTGAGLGGGSANAGLLLAKLIKHCGLADSRARELAPKLGADVPFFLDARPMLVHGIGEILEPIEVSSAVGVLCLPDVAVATGAAYAQLKRPLHSAPSPKTLHGLSDRVRAALATSQFGEVQSLTNDFEVPVYQAHPELASVKLAFLQRGASFASLSGSGSSIYGLLNSEDEADSKALLKAMQSGFPGHRFRSFRIIGG